MVAADESAGRGAGVSGALKSLQIFVHQHHVGLVCETLTKV